MLNIHPRYDRNARLQKRADFRFVFFPQFIWIYNYFGSCCSAVAPLLQSVRLRQYDANNEPTYIRARVKLISVRHACLAPATLTRTRARLARRDFNEGVEFLACAWVLGPLCGARWHRHGHSRSQGHSASKLRSPNVAARRPQKIRGFLEIFTVFVYRGLGAWRNFAGPGLLLQNRLAGMA